MRKSCHKFDDEIRNELPNSVELEYCAGILIDCIKVGLDSKLTNAYLYDVVTRRCNGLKFWEFEPLEKTIRRAVDKAKKLASAYEAK